jgi:hypothetical protein
VEYVAAQYFYEPISAPKTATATTSPSLDQRTWHRSNTHYRNSFQIQKALNCDDAKVNGIGSGRGLAIGFQPGLVGPFRSVEDGFELCGWLFVEVGVQAAGVMSVADGTSVSYWRTGRVRSSCSGIS